jgi:hypothetical protein
MTKLQLFENMKKLWESFEAAHNGTTKKSQSEARKISNELKKLVPLYRKASVEEGKNK